MKDSNLSDALHRLGCHPHRESEDKENPIFARSCPYQD
jgi:hypothetical protein